MNWVQADKHLYTSTTGDASPLDLSVICPFYNEGEIIGEAVRILLQKMDELNIDWELLVVNDGSTDGSDCIVAEIAANEPRLRLLSYPHNHGRGYALRTGIARARGSVIVTTEIDLSWGEEIIRRLYFTMLEQPQIDITVASPNLLGGGYRNVPFKRVAYSRVGNLIVRTLMSNAVSMNTGMTRAYRRDVIQSLPLEADRKEFHLEVIMKAQALNYRIAEIPCVLEWKEYKHKNGRVQRKSSSNIKRLIISHSLFSLFANPIRYVWALGVTAAVLCLVFLSWSIVRLFMGEVSVFTSIISLSLAIIAVLFFGFGVIAQQSLMIQREIWTLKRDITHLRNPLETDEVRELNRHWMASIELTNGEPTSAVYEFQS